VRRGEPGVTNAGCLRISASYEAFFDAGIHCSKGILPLSRHGLGDDAESLQPAAAGTPPSTVVTDTIKAQHLSPLPVFVAGAALVLSTILMVIGRAWPLPLLGWILTPFVVVGCLVWARVLFVRSSTNPLFDRVAAKRILVVLQALTFVAFIASLPHVWRIGQEVALWLQ